MAEHAVPRGSITSAHIARTYRAPNKRTRRSETFAPAAVSVVDYFTVSSSAIESVGYDPKTMTLAIGFANGREYHYYDVPPEVVEELRAAPSAGRFVNEHIKTAGYQYARSR
jgi:hypothetical protein